MFNITGYCQQTTVSIGSITVTKTGDSVIVPVNVTNFNSIGSFGFWIKIDTNVIIRIILMILHVWRIFILPAVQD